MDQAALAHQGVLRHQRERREDPNLDRGVGLCAGGDRAQAVGDRGQLYQILQILSLTLFEKTPISCALQAIDGDANFAENANQLILFDF